MSAAPRRARYISGDDTFQSGQKHQVSSPSLHAQDGSQYMCTVIMYNMLYNMYNMLYNMCITCCKTCCLTCCVLNVYKLYKQSVYYNYLYFFSNGMSFLHENPFFPASVSNGSLYKRSLLQLEDVI